VTAPAPSGPAGGSVDPITAEIIARALDHIADEMAITMYRTARSPIVNETRDFATAVCDGQGRLVGQSLGAPFLMVTSREAVRAVVRAFDDLKPGDVFLNNDSYWGGSHLGDLTVTAPLFHDGRLVLLPSIRAHQIDAGGGGVVAGGFNSRAVEIWEESTRIPPLRLVDGGRMRDDVYEWLVGNSRFPDQFHGDLQAMLATCMVAERRFRELIDRWGWDAIEASMDHALDHSERMAREAIQDWPDGTYPADVMIDGDGSKTMDVRLHVEVRVAGDEVVVDFTGTDQQGAGALNSPLANTLSWTMVAIAGLLDESLPKNEGIFRPITIVAPEGSVLNAQDPAANGYCTLHPGDEIAELVTLALSQALPERVGSLWLLKPKCNLGGVDPRTGRTYLTLNFVMNNAGDGATHGQDGWGGLPVTRGGMAYTTVEMAELQYPHRIESREFQPDTGGAGQWRGGCGIRSVQRVLDHTAHAACVLWGGKYPSVGLCGGASGGPNAIRLEPAGGVAVDVAPGRSTDADLPAGSLVTMVTGGGGGWGNPLERSPEDVRSDVVNGYVSLRGAREDYGVEIDPGTFQVVTDATPGRRTAARGADSTRRGET
jgi:N-methylhydantoinase B